MKIHDLMNRYYESKDTSRIDFLEIFFFEGVTDLANYTSIVHLIS